MVLVENLRTNFELDKESLCISEGRFAPSFVKYDCEEVLEFNKDRKFFLDSKPRFYTGINKSALPRSFYLPFLLSPVLPSELRSVLMTPLGQRFTKRLCNNNLFCVYILCNVKLGTL